MPSTFHESLAAVAWFVYLWSCSALLEVCLHKLSSSPPPQLSFQMDFFERGLFSSGCWMSAMFWDGWRSLLEDGVKPLRVLACFTAK